MLDARRPNLLPIDNIPVTGTNSRRADAGGIRACIRFRYPKSLESQISGCNLRKIEALLFFRPVAQERPHDVHLGMTRGSISTGAVDFFENDRCFPDS